MISLPISSDQLPNSDLAYEQEAISAFHKDSNPWAGYGHNPELLLRSAQFKEAVINSFQERVASDIDNTWQIWTQPSHSWSSQKYLDHALLHPEVVGSLWTSWVLASKVSWKLNNLIALDEEPKGENFASRKFLLLDNLIQRGVDKWTQQRISSKISLPVCGCAHC